MEESLAALTALPAAQQFTSQEVLDLMKSGVGRVDLIWFCKLPGAMEIQGEQLASLLQLAINSKAWECVYELLKLPGREGLEVKEVGWVAKEMMLWLAEHGDGNVEDRRLGKDSTSRLLLLKSLCCVLGLPAAQGLGVEMVVQLMRLLPYAVNEEIGRLRVELGRDGGYYEVRGYPPQEPEVEAWKGLCENVLLSQKGLMLLLELPVAMQAVQKLLGMNEWSPPPGEVVLGFLKVLEACPESVDTLSEKYVRHMEGWVDLEVGEFWGLIVAGLVRSRSAGRLLVVRLVRAALAVKQAEAKEEEAGVDWDGHAGSEGEWEGGMGQEVQQQQEEEMGEGEEMEEGTAGVYAAAAADDDGGGEVGDEEEAYGYESDEYEELADYEVAEEEEDEQEDALSILGRLLGEVVMGRIKCVLEMHGQQVGWALGKLLRAGAAREMSKVVVLELLRVEAAVPDCLRAVTPPTWVREDNESSFKAFARERGLPGFVGLSEEEMAGVQDGRRVEVE